MANSLTHYLRNLHVPAASRAVAALCGVHELALMSTTRVLWVAMLFAAVAPLLLTLCSSGASAQWPVMQLSGGVVPACRCALRRNESTLLCVASCEVLCSEPLDGATVPVSPRIHDGPRAFAPIAERLVLFVQLRFGLLADFKWTLNVAAICRSF
jgi:hypothetical protein